VRKELRRWLRRLHDELHISSIFVTHDQEEALEVADRVVLMNKGRVEQIGSPHQIYNEPATSFAYSFIGNVNAFRGKVEGSYVRIGDDLLPHGRSDLAEGAPVVAYARPHDTQIVPDNVDAGGISAKVNRILASGAVSRVELIANGLARQGRTEYFEVELTPSEIAALELEAGKPVRITSHNLSVFGENNIQD
jgi:sulfate transport system ATP-binding protein